MKATALENVCHLFSPEDYRHLRGGTPGHAIKGQRVSREQGSCAQDHRPSLRYCSRVYWKNSPVLRLFPPTQEMKGSMVDSVMEWQNFRHAWLGDREEKKIKWRESKRGCRITSCGYQQYSGRFPSCGSKTPRRLVIPWCGIPRKVTLCLKAKAICKLCFFLKVIPLWLFPFTPFSLLLFRTSAVLDRYQL